jgi:DNA-binding MarR family transcriptional regulator
MAVFLLKRHRACRCQFDIRSRNPCPRDPNVTRLLDRLERRELIKRERQQRDRRVITTRITPAGLPILSTLDEPISALHQRLLGHLGPERLQILNDLLEAARVSKE